MKIAVITPYYKETNEQLLRAHHSVMAQKGADITHIMVSDGFPNPIVDEWENTVHIKVPNHADYGDTPRAIGGLYATNKGFDAVMLLDADNWFEEHHLETLLAIQKENNVSVVTATRYLRRPDESILDVCVESNGDSFNDTNCYLIMADGMKAFASWGFKDPKFGIIGDRFFWNAIKDLKLTRAHCEIPTVNYATTFGTHYIARGEWPPAGSKVIASFAGEDVPRMLSFETWAELLKKQKKI